jgi:hypothetical protein
MTFTFALLVVHSVSVPLIEMASVFGGVLVVHVWRALAEFSNGLNLAPPFWNVVQVIVRGLQSTTAALPVEHNASTPIGRIAAFSQFVRMISFLPLFIDRSFGPIGRVRAHFVRCSEGAAGRR